MSKKNNPKKNNPKKKKPQKKKGGLGDDQKKFIEKKVKKLKTIEAVGSFYNRDDVVSAYAKEMAEKFKLPSSPPKKIERKKGERKKKK